MSGHPMFTKILKQYLDLHESKACDYGTNNDPLANARCLSDVGLPAWYWAAFRIMEKVQRVKSFIRNGSLKHDSIEEDLTDIACIATIGLILIREQQDAETKTILDGHSVPVPVSEK